jgi:hypothetical protein
LRLTKLRLPWPFGTVQPLCPEITNKLWQNLLLSSK